MSLRTAFREWRGGQRFTGPVMFGDTEIDEAKIAAIGDLSSEEVAAIVAAGGDIVALQTAVGTYNGEDDLATDVASLQTTVNTADTGLTDRVVALEATVSTLEYAVRNSLIEDLTVGTTYTYASTPGADVTVAITAGKTCAVITPGGATSHNLTFTLPTTNTTDTDVFHVTYDKGTHAGTLTIQGVARTGSGVLHYFWTGTAWATWSTGAYSVTLSDQITGIIVSLEDAGSSNTLTLVLPTGEESIGKDLCLVVDLTADAATACTLNLTGSFYTSSGITDNVEDVKNGVYNMKCIAAGVWVPFEAKAISVNT